MNPAADQLALELARWSWYARDALAGAEFAHQACRERVRRFDTRADSALLATQRLRQHCDREGQRLAGALAALVASKRRARARADALAASLARIDASMTHWTAQLASAEREGDLQSPRCQACRRALRQVGVVRQSLLEAIDDHQRVVATIDDAGRVAADAAEALQQARSAMIDTVDPGAPTLAARRLLSEAQGHLDVARVVHGEAQRLAANARRRVGEHAGRNTGAVSAVERERG